MTADDRPSQATQTALEKADAKLRRAIIFMVAMALVMGAATVMVFAVTDNEGDAVGALQFEQSEAESHIDLQPGDRLRFYFDLRVTGSNVPNVNRSQTAGSFYDATLALSLRAPDGSEQATRCNVYNGVHGGERSSSSAWSILGAHNSCKLTVEHPGRHRLTGKVQWASSTPSHAVLEVRRED